MVARNLEPLKHKINIILTVLSAVFLSVATIINWWTQGYGDSAVHFSVWKMVICESGVCLVSTLNTSGWINFVRLMIIVGLTGLLGTLVAQIIYWFKPHNSLKTTSLVFSTVTGATLMVTGFVIVGFFHSISKKYNTATLRLNLNPEALRYQTLPLGFIFLSSFISSVVAVFTLVNIEPKQRKMEGEYEMAPLRSSKTPS